MASLFGPRATKNNFPVNSQNQIQNGLDREAIVENAIQQSGGDAKTAFYIATREMGLDPNDVLSEMQSMGNMKEMAQKVMMSNPKIRRLASLFSLMK